MLAPGGAPSTTNEHIYTLLLCFLVLCRPDRYQSVQGTPHQHKQQHFGACEWPGSRALHHSTSKVAWAPAGQGRPVTGTLLRPGRLLTLCMFPFWLCLQVVINISANQQQASRLLQPAQHSTAARVLLMNPDRLPPTHSLHGVLCFALKVARGTAAPHRRSCHPRRTRTRARTTRTAGDNPAAATELLNMPLLHHLLQEAQAVYAHTSMAPTQQASAGSSNTTGTARNEFAGTICGKSVKWRLPTPLPACHAAELLLVWWCWARRDKGTTPWCCCARTPCWALLLRADRTACVSFPVLQRFIRRSPGCNALPPWSPTIKHRLPGGLRQRPYTREWRRQPLRPPCPAQETQGGTAQLSTVQDDGAIAGTLQTADHLHVPIMFVSTGRPQRLCTSAAGGSLPPPAPQQASPASPECPAVHPARLPPTHSLRGLLCFALQVVRGTGSHRRVKASTTRTADNDPAADCLPSKTTAAAAFAITAKAQQLTVDFSAGSTVRCYQATPTHAGCRPNS